MQIGKIIAADAEMKRLRLEVACAEAARDAAREQLEHEGMNSAQWSQAASAYAAACAVIHKAHHRVRILRGRIHFEAQTA